jgi:hypothetical protein
MKNVTTFELCIFRYMVNKVSVRLTKNSKEIAVIGKILNLNNSALYSLLLYTIIRFKSHIKDIR